MALDDSRVSSGDEFVPMRYQIQALMRRARRWVVLGAGLVVVIWLLSGLYIIQPGEQGVVLFFGSYIATSAPGINYRLPTPIHGHAVVDMQAIRRAG
jgi:regulator of protease activity HflC (stomatin/prohibitin superfamily)